MIIIVNITKTILLLFISMTVTASKHPSGLGLATAKELVKSGEWHLS